MTASKNPIPDSAIRSPQSTGFNPKSKIQNPKSLLSRRIAITVFVFNAFYATTYLGNPMSTSMLDLTVSLVDRRALDIDPYAGNSTDIARHGGHFYSGMPPGVSLVCVPYYLAAKTWLRLVATPERERATDERFVKAKGTAWQPSEKHLTIVLLNLFICVFGCAAMAGAMAALFHHALTVIYPDLEERRRLATTWLFSFDTLWFIYSAGIYHRVFSTFLCFVAFLLVLPFCSSASCGRATGSRDDIERPQEAELQHRRWRGLLFGAALGLAIACSYEMAIVAAILIVLAATQCGRHWPWGWTVVGAAFFLGLLAAYHTACFGAPWATPYAARIRGSVVPPLFRTHGNASVFSLRRMAEFLAGSRYGFSFYSPLLLLALPSLVHLCRRPASTLLPSELRIQNPQFKIQHAVVAVAFAIFISLLAFHYVTGYDGLPGEFGFRMMKPAIPFLMLLVPLSYGWSYRCVVPTLAALSAIILGKGVMFGVHAGRPFWGNYLDYMHRYGFANYTLANLKDNLWPPLSPWAISAIHLAALAVIALFLWRFVWRAKILDGHGDAR
jgi:hypothetical protein